MSNETSRRFFLMSTAAGAAAFAMPKMLRAQNATSPSSKLNVACIGVGGRGHEDMMATARCKGVNIAALCDVDSKMIEKAQASLHAAATKQSIPESTAKTYADFRKMLDEMKNDIDAVTIATPDHCHAPAAIRAMSLGKHVYVEKPLTYTLREARTLREAAQKYKVVTQMGNQHHSSEGAHQVVEYINSGALGPIKEVHCWTDRPIWPQGMNWPKSAETPKVPANLDWDLWLGPTTRELAYDPSFLPFKWRGWTAWGTGALGDMGCHIMDTANWALDLSRPTSVEALQALSMTDAAYPTASVIKYTFPARGEKRPCTLTWYDGHNASGHLNQPELYKWAKIPDNGTIWIGEKGSAISAYDGPPRPLGEDLEHFKFAPKTLPRSQEHHQEFVTACTGGRPADCNFEYACPLTELVLLGNLPLRAGKKIEWDAEKMEVTNDSSANQYVTREYRKGWEI
jgi:predicted dehydrogenase